MGSRLRGPKSLKTLFQLQKPLRGSKKGLGELAGAHLHNAGPLCTLSVFAFIPSAVGFTYKVDRVRNLIQMLLYFSFGN